jgi:hypothetical protein
MQRAFTNPKYTETTGDVYMISGCRDEQTSADAYINNAFAGALTYAVFAILRANQATIRSYTWSTLLRDVRHFMRVNRYTQIPQLMTGQLITPARPVFTQFAATAAAATAPARGLVLEANTGISSRGVSHDKGSTLFHFIPKSGSLNKRINIQFIH